MKKHKHAKRRGVDIPVCGKAHASVQRAPHIRISTQHATIEIHFP